MEEDLNTNEAEEEAVVTSREEPIITNNENGFQQTANVVDITTNTLIHQNYIEEIEIIEPVLNSTIGQNNNEQSDDHNYTKTSNKKKRKSRSSPNSIPSPKSKNDSTNSDDGSVCPICLEQWEVSGPHRLSSLKCGHLYGESCIKQWFKERPSGTKCCPTCKEKSAGNRDIRYLYAKRLCVVDKSEEYKLKQLLTEERAKYSQLAAEYDSIKVESTLNKCRVNVLEDEINRLRQMIKIECDTYSINSDSQPLINYKVFMEKNIELSKEAGCRVMVYSQNINNLIVSQKSSYLLFPGYGIRFIETYSFRPSNFVYLSSKVVRDIGLSTKEDLLITATMEKSSKLLNMSDRSVMNTFTPSDKPIWACSFHKELPSNLYLGTQHGSTYFYDIRQTSTFVEEFKTEGDMSPVINICSIPYSDNFPFSGLLVCKLQSIWFHGINDNISTKLNVEGPFISMTYEYKSGSLLIATRPSTKFTLSRSILAKLIKVNNTVALNITNVFYGSKVQSAMCRSTQINLNDNILIASYLEDVRSIGLWDFKKNCRTQSLPMTDIVYDMCPIYQRQRTFLAALNENKCKIYKITSTEDS